MSYTPPPPPPPPGAGGYPPQTNQKALWAMILGILSLVLCGIFAGVAAIILGNSAQKEIAGSGGMQTGQGMAKAGIILGWISVALTVLVVIFVVVGTVTSNS